MNRRLTFRFDVDTELCLREGLPRLLEIADRLAVRFTFFVNPGRAIRRRDLFAIRDSNDEMPITKLPILRKLGLGEAAYLFLVNPTGLLRHGPALRQVLASGHEIGLHGGRNHGAWSRNALRWGSRRVAEEVDFGIQRFRDAGLGTPMLFASPGWTSPASLPEILSARGLKVLADSYGARSEIPDVLEEGVAQAHTAICGEPGGVGYLEFMRAKGADNEEIVKDFKERLGAENNFACVYDHPYYAGRFEPEMVSSLITCARSEGWNITTLSRALGA